MNVQFESIATVKNSRVYPEDDHWEEIVSEIILGDHIPADAFSQMKDFSHFDVIYFFDRLTPKQMVFARHPRDNPQYPYTGVFAQRTKDRPNPIGLCRVELIEQKERSLFVKYLDAINGTPVLDIKPVFLEFEAQSKITQPEWVGSLMKHYWR